MEKNSMFLGIGLFVVLSIIIIYFNLKNKNLRKKEVSRFLALGKQKGLTFTEYEIWRNRSIGMDTDQKALLFQRKNEQEQVVELIDLKEVLKCDSSTRYNEVGTQKVIQRLELKLVFKTKDRPDILLNFFDDQLGYQIGDELQLLSQWKTKIGKLI